MRRIFWIPNRLFWQLALSYALVTLVAAITIICVMTLGPVLRDTQQSSTLLEQILGKNVMMQTYLEYTPPNEEALRYWVVIPAFDSLTKAHIKTSIVAIAVPSIRIIAPTACGTAQLLSSSAQQCAELTTSHTNSSLVTSQVQKTIATALTNGGAHDQVTSKLSTGKTLIVIPIVQGKNRVIGAMVAVVDSSSLADAQAINTAPTFFDTFWNYLGLQGFYFTGLASVLGTIVGLLTSRNIARRLRHIIQAAEAWSRGEFQTVLNDCSSDEVGQLARNLNGMAEQLPLLLATRQELAIAEERNRLARELHDSVKQHIFTNALLIRAAEKVMMRDPQKAQQYLWEAEGLVEQVQQDLAELIQALHPGSIIDKGLTVVMPDYLDAWSRRTGITSKIHIQKIHIARIDIETTLFRVFQEALTNVARHSKARQVEVQLMSDNNFLCLTI